MMRMIGRKETVMNFHRIMIELENAFLKKVKDLNGKVWWETFLFYLSFFIRRLEYCRFLNIKEESLSMDMDWLHIKTMVKKDKYFLEKPITFHLPNIPSDCQSENLLLNATENVIGLAVHDSEFVREHFFIDLPEHAVCKSCKLSLGGKKAQWDLNTPTGMFKILYAGLKEIKDPTKILFEDPKCRVDKDLFLIRYPLMPVILMETLVDGREGFYAVCNTLSCLLAANDSILTYMKKSASANLECQGRLLQCDSCLMMCANTHRCAHCKSRR